MATVTKPPVKSRLTIKDAACHRLVRFLMRAYYETEHIVVVDCLLDLQVKNPNKSADRARRAREACAASRCERGLTRDRLVVSFACLVSL